MVQRLSTDVLSPTVKSESLTWDESRQARKNEPTASFPRLQTRNGGVNTRFISSLSRMRFAYQLERAMPRRTACHAVDCRELSSEEVDSSLTLDVQGVALIEGK
jgi:hypothetical protein